MSYFSLKSRPKTGGYIFITFVAIWSILLTPSAYATMEEALFAARNRNFEVAFKLFHEEAKKGNFDAQYRLAGMHRSGHGTAKDNLLALKWYQKAADGGHVKAQKRLLLLQNDTVLKGKKSEGNILKAVRKEDRKLLKGLIKAGVDINFQDKFGVTALMESARLKGAGITELLLSNGANTALKNNEGDTALLIAATTGSLDVVKTLIQSGANLNDLNKKKCTALILTLYRNDQAMAEYLISKGADIFLQDAKGRSAYDIALGYKNSSLMAQIKASGGKKLARLLANREKENHLKQFKAQSESNKSRGWSPVMYASWRGDKEAVKSALSSDQNLDKKDTAGMTALALAAQGGHLKIMYMLLDAGADLRCAADIEKHAFFIASKRGHAKVVKSLVSALKDSPECEELLQSSLNYSLRNKQMDIADLLLKNGTIYTNQAKTSPLIIMAAEADAELVEELVKNGVDVNAKTPSGETALMIAAQHDNQVAIQSLLIHRADIDAKDNLGRTALIHAAQKGQINCVKYLTEQGSDVLWLTREGNTSLMLAAEKGYVSVVSYLSKYEELDHKNNIGDTALIMAARGGFYEISEILLKLGVNPRIRNKKRENAILTVNPNNENLISLLEEYESSRSWLKDIF